MQRRSWQEDLITATQTNGPFNMKNTIYVLGDSGYSDIVSWAENADDIDVKPLPDLERFYKNALITDHGAIHKDELKQMISSSILVMDEKSYEKNALDIEIYDLQKMRIFVITNSLQNLAEINSKLSSDCKIEAVSSVDILSCLDRAFDKSTLLRYENKNIEVKKFNKTQQIKAWEERVGGVQQEQEPAEKTVQKTPVSRSMAQKMPYKTTRKKVEYKLNGIVGRTAIKSLDDILERVGEDFQKICDLNKDSKDPRALFSIYHVYYSPREDRDPLITVSFRAENRMMMTRSYTFHSDDDQIRVLKEILEQGNKIFGPDRNKLYSSLSFAELNLKDGITDEKVLKAREIINRKLIPPRSKSYNLI